jgi:hypothetical protein
MTGGVLSIHDLPSRWGWQLSIGLRDHEISLSLLLLTKCWTAGWGPKVLRLAGWAPESLSSLPAVQNSMLCSSHYPVHFGDTLGLTCMQCLGAQAGGLCNKWEPALPTVYKVPCRQQQLPGQKEEKLLRWKQQRSGPLTLEEPLWPQLTNNTTPHTRNNKRLQLVFLGLRCRNTKIWKNKATYHP